jgi:hypothetical protein
MIELQINDRVKWGPHTGTIIGEVYGNIVGVPTTSSNMSFAVKCDTMNCKDEQYTYDIFCIKGTLLERIKPEIHVITDLKAGDVFQWEEAGNILSGYIFEAKIVYNESCDPKTQVMYGITCIPNNQNLYKITIYTKAQMIALLNCYNATKKENK